MISVLVTGGCGFIGSNFVRHVLMNTQDVRVINLDALTYAGNLANLEDMEKACPERYQFLKGDIGDRAFVEEVFNRFPIDWVAHFAAESHVDRSILGPEAFVRTNVLGTFHLIEACRTRWPLGLEGKGQKERFLHISTDEVYGSLGESGRFTEKTPYDPSSPYSASKAASDHLVRAYARTYGLPAIVTHCSNNYGPYQFPEKLIPLMIHNAWNGKALPVYGDGRNVRDWIYVEDHCRALLQVLERGIPGETYNIGGDCEKENREVVGVICDTLDELLGKRQDGSRRGLITFVKDRPGHDRRYAIDSTRIRRELEWAPLVSFEKGMRLTVEWYLRNGKWVEDILDGSYMAYYERQYGERLRGR